MESEIKTLLTINYVHNLDTLFTLNFPNDSRDEFYFNLDSTDFFIMISTLKGS